MSRPWNAALGPQPTLADGVLRLEPYTADEAGLAGMGAWDADPEHQRWFDWPQGRTSDRAEREAGIAAARAAWQDGSRWCFMAREALGEAVLGWCELAFRPDRTEVSYGVLPGARRRGVGRRALRLLCAYAFARTDVARVELRSDLENAASCALAEAAGFRLERTFPAEAPVQRYEPLRGQRREMALYALRRCDAARVLESAATTRPTASASSRNAVA